MGGPERGRPTLLAPPTANEQAVYKYVQHTRVSASPPVMMGAIVHERTYAFKMNPLLAYQGSCRDHCVNKSRNTMKVVIISFGNTAPSHPHDRMLICGGISPTEEILETISEEMEMLNPDPSTQEWTFKVHLGEEISHEVVAEVTAHFVDGTVIPTQKPTPLGVTLVARHQDLAFKAQMAWREAHDEFVRVLTLGKGEEYDELLFATREERRTGEGHALDGMWESAHNYIRGI